MSVETAEIFEFYGFRLDPVRRQLLNPEGVPVPLMPKATETLVHLVMHAGQTIGKDELLRRVWPNVFVEENNLTQNISALRKAFGEKLGEHRFIVTIPGQGYRFVAPVTKLNAKSGPTIPAEMLPIPKPKMSVRRIQLFGLGTIALLGAAVVLFWQFAPKRVDESLGEPRTIAILPFKPVIEAHRNEAMEFGMADSLILELSRSSHLVVRPLSATRAFTALDQDPLEAGRALEVTAVIDGTLQIADGRIRAAARMLRVADGRQLWAGKFDEEAKDLFQVQDAIAQRVSEALQVRLGPTSRQTENLRAYELYMRGRVHSMRLVMPEILRGLEHFEQAIAEDPTYALPYAGIADATRAMVLSNDISPSQVASRSRAAAQRAFELAPDLAEANYANGLGAMFFDWDWQRAGEYLARAVDLAPNNAEAHIFLAHLHSNLAHKQEALKHARRASELNPVSPMIAALEGQFLAAHGDHEAAIARLKEVIVLEPRFWLSHHLLAIALIDAGQHEAAVQASAEAKRLAPSQTYSDALTAVALARSGKKEAAHAILQTLLASAQENYVPPSHLALIETALGNHDQAIAHLESALAVRDARLVFLKVDANWNDLRSDRRFQSVMRRVGF